MLLMNCEQKKKKKKKNLLRVIYFLLKQITNNYYKRLGYFLFIFYYYYFLSCRKINSHIRIIFNFKFAFSYLFNASVYIFHNSLFVN